MVRPLCIGPQAVAAPSAVVNDGPEEPTIVWYGVTSTTSPSSPYYQSEVAYRMWSDGRFERRLIRYGQNSCDSGFTECNWLEVPTPPAGDGYACRSDINGDRNVDGADLGLVLGYWGQEITCGEPTYPCFDLGNLDGPVAFR